MTFRLTPGGRRRGRRAGLVAASLLALTFAAGTSSAGAFNLAITNVHGWLPDWHKSVVNTRSEAVTVAKRYSVVVGQSKVYKPWLGAMHATRSRIVVAAYKSSISAGGENYTFVARNH